jgi:hypothetical protein
VIDTRTFKTAQVRLITGAASARGITLTPDGKYALLVHILARYHLPTRRVERGWMNVNALSVIDVRRREVLNTVLLDDGEGNPKNTKSLLLSHCTPPAMASGVHPTAEAAVRSGIKHILMSEWPEADAAAIDAWLKSLSPLPSPSLAQGRLSPAAQRGRRLFESDRVGCARCHPAPLYTDRKTHDVGSRGEMDDRTAFDTPTLVEAWRTAPYMHDGHYPTIHQLLTDGKHGRAHTLSPAELADLVQFVLSL